MALGGASSRQAGWRGYHAHGPPLAAQVPGGWQTADRLEPEGGQEGQGEKHASRGSPEKQVGTRPSAAHASPSTDLVRRRGARGALGQGVVAGVGVVVTVTGGDICKDKLRNGGAAWSEPGLGILSQESGGRPSEPPSPSSSPFPLSWVQGGM